MFTAAALLLTLSTADPDMVTHVGTLVVTVQGPSQAQLDRREAVAHARADHAWRQEHAARLAKLQTASLAAARASVARTESLPTELEPAVAAQVASSGAGRGPAAAVGTRTPASE